MRRQAAGGGGVAGSARPARRAPRRAARRRTSSSTCVPRMFVRVKAMLSPKELSTCVCAAKCSTVSMRSCRSTYETRSADVIDPLTKEKDGEPEGRNGRAAAVAQASGDRRHLMQPHWAR